MKQQWLTLLVLAGLLLACGCGHKSDMSGATAPPPDAASAPDKVAAMGAKQQAAEQQRAAYLNAQGAQRSSPNGSGGQ